MFNTIADSMFALSRQPFVGSLERRVGAGGFLLNFLVVVS